MRQSKEFPAGCKVAPAEGCSRGIEDGLPWEDDYVASRGKSLGYEHTGADRVVWVAVQWDDEEDPNWFKKSCLGRVREKRASRRRVRAL